MDALIQIAFYGLLIGAHGGAHALRGLPRRCQQGFNETAGVFSIQHDLLARLQGSHRGISDFCQDETSN